MSSNINKAIKMEIDEIIRIGEDSHPFYRDEPTLSVYDVFKAEQNKNKLKNIFCKELIGELKKLYLI